MASPQVTAADRLGFTLFLALAVHGLIIFGVSFAPEAPRAAPNSLEVTLAMHSDDSPPKKADFIAQANQQGSGTVKDKKELTADQPAPFAAAHPVQLHPPSARQPQPVTSQRVIVTAADSEQDTADRQKKKSRQTPRHQSDQDSMADLTRQIASLQARLDQQREDYARRPRVRRLTSVSTKAHYEALYIDDFRRRVEAMGTRHFPHQALASHTFGSVRLMVAINRDGSIRKIKLLHSSGHAFLDQAAIQSVRLAAPFKPFTPEMRKHMDVLEIIRTWKFHADRRVSSR